MEDKDRFPGHFRCPFPMIHVTIFMFSVRFAISRCLIGNSSIYISGNVPIYINAMTQNRNTLTRFVSSRKSLMTSSNSTLLGCGPNGRNTTGRGNAESNRGGSRCTDRVLTRRGVFSTRGRRSSKLRLAPPAKKFSNSVLEAAARCLARSCCAFSASRRRLTASSPSSPSSRRAHVSCPFSLANFPGV